MNAKIGVLVFPAGEVNSVELHDALSACVNIRLYGASSVDRHGEFVFKNYISGIPSIQDPDFLDELNHLIQKHQIDVVIPTHDDVALFFAAHQKDIKASVLTAEYQTALVCRDKKKTYEAFADCDFCPEVYPITRLTEKKYAVDSSERPNVPASFPLFMKPRKGQGSINARQIFNIKELPADDSLDEYVFCEYLPGMELTVDCFTSHSGELQAVLPRSRQRVFGGISVRGRTEVLTTEIQKIAETINSRLHFLGLWYFQIKQGENGRFKLLEISARCAGTMCLSRAKGVNLPLLSVYAAIGKNTEILENEYSLTVDRTLISRYKTTLQYDRVYIDFDDTILADGKVNLQSIRFLYQCANSQKKVVLLTHHKADHNDSAVDALRSCRIDPGLFDEIIELSFDVPKYTIILPEGSIFIDNAYCERREVHQRLGIPVFDVDGIEVLLDWRT